VSEKPHVVEERPTWRLLSNGDVILPGHPLWNSVADQSQSPKPPAGPRKVLRREFDEMDDAQKWEAVRSGAVVVDSPQTKPVPAPRQPPAIRRANFDAMSEAEKRQVVADINAGDARLVD
jgi:hypothetical protein